MPDMIRQKSSGALIFTPTPDERIARDTSLALEQTLKQAEERLATLNKMIEKLEKES